MTNSSDIQRGEIWSLFTGAMGLDLGLERCDLHPTLAVEIDRVCCQTLARNRPGLDAWNADVGTLTARALLERRPESSNVFLMVAGPPCQSFSPAGKRAGLADPRGNLIYVYLRLINEVRPRYFVLENVANLVTAALRHRPIALRPGKKWNLSSYTMGSASLNIGGELMEPDELSGSAIRQVFNDMTTLGYDLHFSIVDSSEYGAPQRRLRFVMLGSRDGPAPTLSQPSFGDAPRGTRVRTVRDAIYDLRNDPGAHSQYTPDVARFFDLIPPGGNWRSLPRALQEQALGQASFEAGGGKTGFYRRLAWDAPAPTITGRANRKASALCHPDQTRPLSVRECARLQGFPDDWAFAGSMSDQYLQIGNAVPVPLGEAIGRAIVEAERVGGRPAEQANFERMLTAAIDRLKASARNRRVPKERTAEVDLFSTLADGER